MKAIAERVPSQRLREVVLQQKTAVDVGSLADSTWANPLDSMSRAIHEFARPV